LRPSFPDRTAFVHQFIFAATVLVILCLAGQSHAQDMTASNSAGSADEVLVVRGAKIYPISGPPIENGVLVVRGGKIEAVGAASSVTVPANARVIDATGKIVMPGIVDTHSHIGIIGNPPIASNQDANEGSGPLQPQLRAMDAINPAASGIRVATSGGITTANIMPGSGNVIGGQTAYVKLRGNTIEEMLIPGAIGGLKMANGENPKGYGRRDLAPMTRMEVAALARKEYTRAEEYRVKWDAYNKAVAAGNKDAKQPDRDLGMEALVQVLDGKRIVQHHTHRADDIMTVLRIADEFHYRVVIHHGSEAYQVANELAKRHIPVTLTIVDSPGGKEETVDIVDNGAAILEKAGVKLAINTDDPINNSRFLIRAAAMAVRGGMTEDGAMRALTINAAEMLDLGNRVGSLEKGKDADFIILSGPPFSVYTKVLETWIEGQKVFDRSNPADLRYATGGYDVAGRYPNFHATAAGGAQ
jgi:imidazolonepropionase-like amidohydrolase